MPNEFDPLHRVTQQVTKYLGKFERQLLEWDRNFTAHLNKLKGQKAKDIAELEATFKVFEDGLPRLVKMSQSKDPDDKTNLDLVFKRYKESWDEIFIPYTAPLLKTIAKFKDLTEMNSVIRGVRTQLDALKRAGTGKDGKTTNMIKFKFKDASWALLNGNVAKVEDGKVTVTIRPTYHVRGHFLHTLREETYDSLDEARESIKKRYRIKRESGTTFWVH